MIITVAGEKKEYADGITATAPFRQGDLRKNEFCEKWSGGVYKRFRVW